MFFLRIPRKRLPVWETVGVTEDWGWAVLRFKSKMVPKAICVEDDWVMDVYSCLAVGRQGQVIRGGSLWVSLGRVYLSQPFP